MLTAPLFPRGGTDEWPTARVGAADIITSVTTVLVVEDMPMIAMMIMATMSLMMMIIMMKMPTCT